MADLSNTQTKGAKNANGVYFDASAADFDAVMDEYKGKPAIFIKGKDGGVTPIILRYFKDNSDTLKFEFIKNSSINDLKNDVMIIESDPKYASIETAAWGFELRVVPGNDLNYVTQEKKRIENGISYEMYLNGEA